MNNEKSAQEQHDYDREFLNKIVTVYYDIQELRIKNSQRSKAAEKLEIIELNREDQESVDIISGSFENLEKLIEKQIKKILKRFGIWNGFLKEVTGIGPMMGGVIISRFNPFDDVAPESYSKDHDGAYVIKLPDGAEKVMRIRTVSQFWAYAGLHPIKIKDKEGNIKFVAARPVAGEKINYDPWLRSKLLGVLASSFIKSRSPYRLYYDERKKYKVEKGWGENNMHRHRDAMRHMIKCFLLDLYYAFRKEFGLPIRKPYAIDKLGLSPSAAFHVEQHPGIKRISVSKVEETNENVGTEESNAGEEDCPELSETEVDGN